MCSPGAPLFPLRWASPIRDEARRRPLSALLIVLVSACGGGGQKEILVNVNPAGACWQPGTSALSLSLLAATELSTQPPRVVGLARECFVPEKPVELTAAAIRLALIQRGQLLGGVDSDRAVFVVVQPYLQPGCKTALKPCLISDTVPPGGARDRVNLNLTCEATPPAPLRARCIAASQAAPAGS